MKMVGGVCHYEDFIYDMNNISHERLLEVLEYDPATGIFIWKVNGRGLARAGSIAGSINGSGYRQIRVDGKLYLAHRLAWFYCFQEWPENIIDHINSIKDDNTLDNLQDVTQSVNIRKANSKIGSSGFRNVRKICNRYQAYIKVAGKTIHIGMFPSGEDAAEAVVAYRNENNI